MKTVIQKIGPLYGEVVNGSVFGQPNGSVATPPYNALVLLLANTDNAYIKKNGTGGFVTCNSNGENGTYLRYQVIAQLPREELRFVIELSATSDFASLLVSNASSVISDSSKVVGGSATGSASIVAGTTYYLRARLTTRDGSTIVTGATYEVEGVVV